MNNKHISSLLKTLHGSIDELEAVLIEEVGQLNRPQINPISLQILSDSKRQLLATIQHYDALRKEAEVTSELMAPYANNAKHAALWQAIMLKVSQASALNKKVHSLLESHLKKTHQIKKIVRQAGADSTLYGASGLSRSQDNGRVCDITI